MAGLFTPPASGAATLQRAARDAAPDARWLLAVSDRNGIVSTSATTCNYPPAAKDSAQDGFRHALAAAIAADIDEALRHGYGDLLELAYPLMSWPRRGVFGGPTPAPRGLATRQCPPRTVHVDRVRPNGAERALGRDSGRFSALSSRWATALTGCPWPRAPRRVHTCRTCHTHPSRWTPNPVPVNKGLPDGLVPATSIMRRDSLLVVKGFCI
ncbi:Uncharacterised protein [Mycobacterium tuberculosis]|nr:Uncharacterised protein [Mycobacterium tuberculosis]